MRKFFSSLKDKFNTNEPTDSDGYMTLDAAEAGRSARMFVRPFNLNDYEDIKEVLNTLRQGNIIVLLNINPLKEKDIVELKRAINKLKKTTEAVNGSIAGFGDDYIVACPAGAGIYRGGDTDPLVYE
jgi:SepF-like predicted cell division protein (DUF552 family)